MQCVVVKYNAQIVECKSVLLQRHREGVVWSLLVTW